MVLRLVDLVWAATYTNRPGVVHGCPDHQPFRMTDGRDNVLGVIPVHPLLDPAPEDVRWGAGLFHVIVQCTHRIFPIGLILNIFSSDQMTLVQLYARSFRANSSLFALFLLDSSGFRKAVTQHRPASLRIVRTKFAEGFGGTCE